MEMIQKNLKWVLIKDKLNSWIARKLIEKRKIRFKITKKKFPYQKQNFVSRMFIISIARLVVEVIRRFKSIKNQLTFKISKITLIEDFRKQFKMKTKIRNKLKKKIRLNLKKSVKKLCDSFTLLKMLTKIIMQLSVKKLKKWGKKAWMIIL